MSNPNETHIRERAYQLWEEEGRPEGHHDHHWQRAEAEVGGSQKPKTGKPKLVQGNAGTGAKTKRA